MDFLWCLHELICVLCVCCVCMVCDVSVCVVCVCVCCVCMCICVVCVSVCLCVCVSVVPGASTLSHAEKQATAGLICGRPPLHLALCGDRTLHVERNALDTRQGVQGTYEWVWSVGVVSSYQFLLQDCRLPLDDAKRMCMRIIGKSHDFTCMQIVYGLAGKCAESALCEVM